MPQGEAAAGRPRSGLVHFGDQRRAPGGRGHSRALLEEGAADALTAVPGVHRQVDVDDGQSRRDQVDRPPARRNPSASLTATIGRLDSAL